MPPIIADPDDFTKRRSYEAGIELAQEFLDANKVPRPHFQEATPLEKGPGRFGYYRENLTAVYERGVVNGTVSVNVGNSRVLTRTPGFAWTFTGWKADLTAAGIVCHEVGHHLEAHIGLWNHNGGSWCQHQMRELHHFGERPVSGYGEVNPQESWAEACRLFILNPDLLRIGWPGHYGVVAQKFKPIVTLGWKDVLAKANPRYHEVVEKLIVNRARYKGMEARFVAANADTRHAAGATRFSIVGSDPWFDYSSVLIADDRFWGGSSYSPGAPTLESIDDDLLHGSGHHELMINGTCEETE